MERITISLPSRIARAARSWLTSARASSSSRLIPSIVAIASPHTPWYQGPTLLEHLETLADAEAVGRELAALLSGYAGINGAARAAQVPTIGLGHGTVTGCITEHGVPMAGFDHEFTTGSLFDAGAQLAQKQCNRPHRTTPGTVAGAVSWRTGSTPASFQASAAAVRPVTATIRMDFQSTRTKAICRFMP